MRPGERVQLIVGMNRVLDDIKCERSNQERKWGRQDHDDFKWLAIALEELGEASQEVLTDDVGVEDGNGHGDLRGEVVQAAAVLVAWLEAIDRRQNG